MSCVVGLVEDGMGGLPQTVEMLENHVKDGCRTVVLQVDGMDGWMEISGWGYV